MATKSAKTERTVEPKVEPKIAPRHFQALADIFTTEKNDDEVWQDSLAPAASVKVGTGSGQPADASESPAVSHPALKQVPPLEVTESGSTELAIPPAVVAKAAKAPRRASQVVLAATPKKDRPMVKSLGMERKDVSLFPDQRDALDGLERQLNRARGRGTGERITANSLIRIAIDLLLERKQELVGVSEEDLRAGLGLSAREGAAGE